jgi:hypothetical protein
VVYIEEPLVRTLANARAAAGTGTGTGAGAGAGAAALAPLAQQAQPLPRGTSVLAVHACGPATDLCTQVRPTEDQSPERVTPPLAPAAHRLLQHRRIAYH